MRVRLGITFTTQHHAFQEGVAPSAITCVEQPFGFRVQIVAPAGFAPTTYRVETRCPPDWRRHVRAGLRGAVRRERRGGHSVSAALTIGALRRDRTRMVTSAELDAWLENPT
jgi:hypothetical protein